MTTAAQAARSETVDDELLKAYLASRPEDYPTPPLNQAAAQFLDEAFEKKTTGDGFCTGYYEPELNGALHRHGPYTHPIYRKPPDLTPDQPYHDRKAITDGALNGQGLELAWLRDPVEAFFLHIQGSGRVRLDDGQVMRVGFAGKNGHPYRSIGKILVERGLFALEDVTAQALKDWLADHPEDA
jgi:membrane-bound lytic murein transglycosylase A